MQLHAFVQAYGDPHAQLCTRTRQVVIERVIVDFRLVTANELVSQGHAHVGLYLLAIAELQSAPHGCTGLAKQ
ncbi:hypothetical protein D3C79_998890 [compost metagenome]